ncbi:MAG: hypothetical protein JWQ07_362 [Ramlibacter sp.]|nr:hypothetical protein [Ramlibacter sp.]
MDPPPGPVGGPDIDWRRPWFAPWCERGEPMSQRVLSGTPLHQALNQEQGAPLRFAAADALPPGVAYEQHILQSGECPTRDNLHDFFNGVVWLGMPRAKARLNVLQAAQIAAHGVGAARGAVRDAGTLFDENGAVLCAPQPLWQALSARDWSRLFIDLRPLWRDARLLIVGHALLEKLVRPRKNLTAHVWNVSGSGGSMAEWDGWLAGELTAERLASKPFLPLPVLGVPGWWPGNDEISFYDDPLVFRPAGRQEPITTQPSAASPT